MEGNVCIIQLLRLNFSAINSTIAFVISNVQEYAGSDRTSRIDDPFFVTELNPDFTPNSVIDQIAELTPKKSELSKLCL